MLSKKYAFVNRETCVACGACLNECKKAAITIPDGCFAVIDTDQCVGCGMCAKICPTASISAKLREE